MEERKRKTTAHGRGITRYYQLYHALSGALQDGSIAAGEALPSEPELVARYGVSRTTVRRALARLEQERRIIRRRGSGTFARESREPFRLTVDLSQLHRLAPASASRLSVNVLQFAAATVPVPLRQLYPELDVPVFRIRRLHLHRDVPYQLSTTYLPAPIARRIRKRKLNRSSLLSVLDDAGSPVFTTEHTTSAVAADAFAARKLKVPFGAPLLRVRAVLRDAQGRLCALDESLFRPDRFYVRTSIERGVHR